MMNCQPDVGTFKKHMMPARHSSCGRRWWLIWKRRWHLSEARKLPAQSFLLESVTDGDVRGRYSMIGLDPI